MSIHSQQDTPMQNQEASPLMRGGHEEAARFEQGDQLPVAPQNPSPINIIWFAAAGAIILGAIMGGLACTFSLEWVDALEMAYLGVFGLVMAVLDTPVLTNIKIIPQLRIAIGRYVHLLTRVAGKGLVFLFLGCVLWSSMWANLENAFLLFCSVLFGGFVVLVGLTTGAVSVSKSISLDKVRKHFRQDGGAIGQGALPGMYQKHARLQPGLGVSPLEFNGMVNDCRGVNFDEGDLRLIFNALASAPRRNVISLADLQAWISGPMVLL